MARFIVTTPGEDFPAGGTGDVVGTATPGEIITITAPANLIFDPSFTTGGDTIDLPGDAEDYSARRDGSNVVLTRNDGQVTITLPVSANPNTLVFDNASRQVQVTGGQIVIGAQTIDNPGGEQLDGGGQSSFNLTQGSDTDPQFTGTSGNDTYRADVVQTGLLPIQTLTNGDDFDAGTGFDRLIAQVVNDVTPAGLNNLEEIDFEGATGFINPAVSVDLVNANALQVLGFNSLNADIAIDNILTSLTGINLNNQSGGGLDIDIEFDGAAVTAGDDELDIDLNNWDGDLDLTGDPGQVYGTVNVDSAGGSATNELDLGGSVAGAPNVNVTGGTDLEFRGTALSVNTLRAFDASNLDADLDAVFGTGDSGAADVTVVGATGTNLLTFNNTAGNLLDISTPDDDDTVFVNTRSGDLTANLGAGDNFFDVDVMSGNLIVSALGGDDEFRFGDGTTITGDVTANAGNGDNTVRVDRVTGAIALTSGTGDDTFEFRADGGSTGLHSFGTGDTLAAGAGADTAIFEGTNVGTGANGVNLFSGGTITGVETLVHVGVIVDGNGTGSNNDDLTVDLDGVDNTANRLELRGTYVNDVRVNNTDGETIAVYSDINPTGLAPNNGTGLIIDNAVLTIDDYNIELNGGVTVRGIDFVDHGPADNADRVTITSLGTGTNVVTNATNVTTDLLILTGGTDLVFGDARTGGSDTNQGFAFGSSTAGQIVDATGLSGDDFIATLNGNMTVEDGDGNDVYAAFSNGGGAVFEFAGGSNALWLLDFVTNSSSANPDDAHHVTGFDVTGPNADVVGIDPNLPATQHDFFRADGTVVADGEAANIRNYEAGDIINLTASSANVIRFTTQVTGGPTLTGASTQVLGAGVITVDGSAVDGDPAVDQMLGLYYDVDRGAMIIAEAEATGTAIVGFTATYAVIEMSYEEFLAFDADNLVFASTLVPVTALQDSNAGGALGGQADAFAGEYHGAGMNNLGMLGEFAHHIA